MRNSKRDSKAKKKKGVFEVPLIQSIQSNKSNNTKIPDIVEQVITYLDKHDFLRFEGIYRVSGRKLRIEQLKEAYDKGKKVIFEENMEDPYTCADLLLLFLRSLPETIFTQEKSHDFERAVDESTDELKIIKIIELIYQLPPVNKYLLKYLMEHLTKVIALEKENKMNVNNISIVFVPSMYCNAKLFAFIIMKFHYIFNPKCKECKRNIPIDEELILIDNNIIQCIKCKNGEHTNGENNNNGENGSRTSGTSSSGYVEASPDPKKKGLIRSISQKWQNRKKDKKGSTSEAEEKTDDETNVRKSDRVKNSKKITNGRKTHNSGELPNANGNNQVSFSEKVSLPIDSPPEQTNNRKFHSSDLDFKKDEKLKEVKQLDSNELTRARYGTRSSSTAPNPIKLSNFDPEKRKSKDTSSIPSKSSVSCDFNESLILNKDSPLYNREPINNLKRVSDREDPLHDFHLNNNVKEEEGILFGTPLDKLCKKNGNSVILPPFIKKSIEYVEKKGLEIEEIYRIPGDIEVVKKIRKTLTDDSVIDFETLLPDLSPVSKCHTVTMLFKLYLRQLPTNIFTEKYIDKLEDIIKNEKEREKKIANLAYYISLLPQENRTLILHLISHFRSVTKKIGKNKMSIQRIAIIFKDVLFCSQELITLIYEYRRAILQPSCFFCKKMLLPSSKITVVDETHIHCGDCDKNKAIIVTKN